MTEGHARTNAEHVLGTKGDDSLNSGVPKFEKE